MDIFQKGYNYYKTWYCTYTDIHMTRYFSAIYNLIPIHGKKEYEAGNIKVMDRIIIQK